MKRVLFMFLQVGTVACCRCGSLQHFTNSTACQLQSAVPSRYTLDGRLKRNDNIPKCRASMVSLEDNVTYTPIKTSPREPTDLSPFPHLQSTLKLCEEAWYGCDGFLYWLLDCLNASPFVRATANSLCFFFPHALAHTGMRALRGLACCASPFCAHFLSMPYCENIIVCKLMHYHSLCVFVFALASVCVCLYSRVCMYVCVDVNMLVLACVYGIVCTYVYVLGCMHFNCAGVCMFVYFLVLVCICMRVCMHG